MKIAVPSTTDHYVNDHFGHCELFVIFSIGEDKRIESTEEFVPPAGCGCKSNLAGMLKEKGIRVVIAGNMGDGAFAALTNHGIKVYRGHSGDVRKAVETFLEGNVTDSGTGCHQHRHGEKHSCHHQA